MRVCTDAQDAIKTQCKMHGLPQHRCKRVQRSVRCTQALLWAGFGTSGVGQPEQRCGA